MKTYLQVRPVLGQLGLFLALPLGLGLVDQLQGLGLALVPLLPLDVEQSVQFGDGGPELLALFLGQTPHISVVAGAAQRRVGQAGGLGVQLGTQVLVLTSENKVSNYEF